MPVDRRTASDLRTEPTHHALAVSFFSTTSSSRCQPALALQLQVIPASPEPQQDHSPPPSVWHTSPALRQSHAATTLRLAGPGAAPQARQVRSWLAVTSLAPALSLGSHWTSKTRSACPRRL
eukprot:1424636-Rhodomonas_salina.1